MSESIAGGQAVDLPVRAGDSLKIGYLGGTYSAVAVAGLSGLPSALATNATTSQTLGPWAQNIVVRLSTSANGRVEYAAGKPPVFAPSGQRFVRTSDGVPVELKGQGANAEYLAAGSNPTAPASLAASGSYSTSLTEGTRYESAAPTVTGGVPPYAFGPSGGALPYGMRVDPEAGVLYGVPSFQGSFGGVKVRAMDQVGSFIDMTVGTITVGAPSGASVPGQPAAPTATAGDGTVSLAFSAPSNGGSAILEYGALLSNGNTNTGNPSASPVSVASANGAAVTGQIRARNAIGWGPYSPASNSVTPSAAAVTGVQFQRRVGTPSTGILNTNNYTQFNTCMRIENRLSVPVNKLRLKFVNAVPHASNGTMISGPRISTFQVGISNTTGTRTLATFSGATSVALEPGQEIWTDEFTLGADIPAAGFGMAMMYIVYESAPATVPTSNINSTNNTYELCEGATSGLASKAAGTTTPASRFVTKVLMSAECILGVPTGTPADLRSFYFFGDSITEGSEDVAGGSNVIGFAQRAAQATNLPWAAAAQGGYTFSAMSAGSNARRFTLSAAHGASHAFCFLGINDMRSGALTPAQCYARMQEVKAELLAMGVPKLIIGTIWPNTNSGNTAEFAANIWSRINALNQLIRDNNGVGDGYFDLNALVRNDVNPDLWANPDGSPGAWNPVSGFDGTHPLQGHHATVATALTAYMNALTI